MKLLSNSNSLTIKTKNKYIERILNWTIQNNKLLTSIRSEGGLSIR